MCGQCGTRPAISDSALCGECFRASIIAPPETDANGRYILEGHEAVPCVDLLTWGRWLEDHRAECGVAHEQFGDYEVSTIFIGLDMNLWRLRDGDNAPPMLFETMVFSGFDRAGGIQACARCSTWTQAEIQHERLARQFRLAAVS
jgi:hypothetical protein